MGEGLMLVTFIARFRRVSVKISVLTNLISVVEGVETRIRARDDGMSQTSFDGGWAINNAE